MTTTSKRGGSRLLLITGLLLALAGCATINPQVATPNQAYIGLNAYDAAVRTGKNYLRLPLCPQQAPICRTATLSQKVYSALRAARPAKEQILLALGTGVPLPVSALEALQVAYGVIQEIPRASASIK